MSFEHISVLLNETIEGLNIKPNGIYVDGTLGGGGHAWHVCSRLSEEGRFIGIDQDAAAISAAGARLEEYGDKVTIVRSNYAGMRQVLKDLGIDKVDGIVINPGGYTHTSVAILDALKAVSIPTVEVHISKVDERESFRQISYVSYYASKTIIGKGLDGYIEAIDFLADGTN